MNNNNRYLRIITGYGCTLYLEQKYLIKLYVSGLVLAFILNHLMQANAMMMMMAMTDDYNHNNRRM